MHRGEALVPSRPLLAFCLQVKRCDESARRLRFFQDQVHKAGLPVKPKAMQEKTQGLDDLEVGSWLACCIR